MKLTIRAGVMLLKIFKRSRITPSNIGLMRARFCTFTTVLKIGTYIYVCFVVLAFTRCAQIGTLSGGAKDTTPPRVIRTIPAEKSTDAKSGVFVFEFDEPVVVKEPAQYLISPQTATKPELLAEGKRLKVTLVASELLPNTTYRMQFGSAIADLHEGNVLNGYTYVFSTGATVDSLEVKGMVTDAVTGAGVTDALVALQNGEGDSLMYKKPLYVTRVNTTGGFSFQSLPEKDFYLFAFTDNNRNGLYDGESERIAFQKGTIRVGTDSVLAMRMFRERAPRTFLKKINQPMRGRVDLILNQEGFAKIDLIETRASEHLRVMNNTNDTVTVFYQGMTDTLRLITQFDLNGQRDTVEVALPALRKQQVLRGIKSNLSSFKEDQPQQIVIEFPLWMDTTTLNPKKIRLLRAKDSSAVAISPRWKDFHTVVMNLPAEPGQRYQLLVDTALAMSKEGMPTEPFTGVFKSEAASDFGVLTITILFAKKKHYLVQLINEAGAVVREEQVYLSLSSSGRKAFVFKSLPPANYRLRVIADENANGKWDTGEALKQLQPEEIFTASKIFNVLADWEAEEEIKSPL